MTMLKGLALSDEARAIIDELARQQSMPAAEHARRERNLEQWFADVAPAKRQLDDKPTTLGARIAKGRKRLGLSQKQLAARLRREDGAALSPQYMNDVERDRRVPTDHLIEQIAKLLDDDIAFLTVLAGRMPPDLWAWLSNEDNYRAWRAELAREGLKR